MVDGRCVQMKNKVAVYVLTVFSILCLMGCCFVYVIDIDHEVSVSLNSDGTVSYEITGFTPSVYSYLVLDKVHTYDSILFYYDGAYPVSGTTDGDVTSLYSRMDKLLSSRGFDEFRMVDAMGLYAAVSDTFSASVTAIFIATGALPDTVQDESGYPLLQSWLSAGGSMYWMMGNPCTKYSTSAGIVTVGCGMFDDSLFNTHVLDKGATTCTRIASDMGFGYYAIDHAIKKDAPNSTPIGLIDDRYSSLSVVQSPYGGNVYIFGGSAISLSFEQSSALADYLVCGISHDTMVIDTVFGEKGYGDMFVTTSPLIRGDLFYLRVGKPNTNVGVAITL